MIGAGQLEGPTGVRRRSPVLLGGGDGVGQHPGCVRLEPSNDHIEGLVDELEV